MVNFVAFPLGGDVKIFEHFPFRKYVTTFIFSTALISPNRYNVTVDTQMQFGLHHGSSQRDAARANIPARLSGAYARTSFPSMWIRRIEFSW